MYVSDAVLISEQITEYRFGGLFEITIKFNSKLNILAIWFYSARCIAQWVSSFG